MYTESSVLNELIPSKQFYSFVPVMGQYSQTNMPELALFWPRVVSIQFAHRATYGPVLVTMSGPVEAPYWPRYQEYIQAAIWLYLPCQYWPRYDYIMAV